MADEHKPRFEIVPDHAGEWFWRLIDTNHKTIATSLGDTFTRAEDAERAVLNVIATAPQAVIVRRDPLEDV